MFFGLTDVLHTLSMRYLIALLLIIVVVQAQAPSYTFPTSYRSKGTLKHIYIQKIVI